MAPLVRGLPLLLSLAMAAGMAAVVPARAQQQGYGQTLTSPSAGGSDPSSMGSGMGSGMGKGGSVLDAVNPIDLMNRIQRSQALEEATPPRDAIDAALRDYATQSSPPAAQGSGASGMVKAP